MLRLRTLALALLLLFAAARSARAQHVAQFSGYQLQYTHPRSQLKDFIDARSQRAFAEGERQRDALGSPADVVKRQEAIRRDFLAGIGGLPPSDTPLHARVTGKVEGDGFTIENIIFESRPRHYVTANLYLPAQRQGRTAAVLFLSGHLTPAKQSDEYQSVCQTLAKAGLIVLAQDPIGQGERFSYYDPEAKEIRVNPGTPDHDMAGAPARLLGDGIARYFVHDAMRGIDYLVSRPEVDPERIGVTGNSGGGTQTSMLMIADPRIAAAAPGTFLTSRAMYMRTGRASDAEQTWPGFTARGYDHEDILLAMAPKPVCMLAVTSDYFPIEGTRRTVTRARRIWDLYGRGEDLELVEDDAIHEYTPDLAKAAARFFARHLLHRDAAAAVAKFQPRPFPPEHLSATRSGQVRAELADAEFVFDATAARLRDAEAERAKLGKARAIEWLRTQVFRDRLSIPLNVRRIDRNHAVGDLDVDVAFWWSQPDLINLGILYRPRRHTGPIPVTIALWNDGTAAIAKYAKWIIAECSRGRAVFVLDVSGMGSLRPDAVNSLPVHDFNGTFHKLGDDLDWLGDSLVALRTFEVLRALDVLGEWPELARDGVRYYGVGRMGVHARLADALDARIDGGEWISGFRFADFVRTREYDSRDVKSFILPGVLRYFDLDEIP